MCTFGDEWSEWVVNCGQLGCLCVCAHACARRWESGVGGLMEGRGWWEKAQESVGQGEGGPLPSPGAPAGLGLG